MQLSKRLSNIKPRRWGDQMICCISDKKTAALAIKAALSVHFECGTGVILAEADSGDLDLGPAGKFDQSSMAVAALFGNARSGVNKN
jgi:hypothetical protein